VQDKIHSQFKKELIDKIPSNYWKILGEFNYGGIQIHTINVLYNIINDRFYLNQLTDYE